MYVVNEEHIRDQMFDVVLMILMDLFTCIAGVCRIIRVPRRHRGLEPGPIFVLPFTFVHVSCVAYFYRRASFERDAQTKLFLIVVHFIILSTKFFNP